MLASVFTSNLLRPIRQLLSQPNTEVEAGGPEEKEEGEEEEGEEEAHDGEGGNSAHCFPTSANSAAAMADPSFQEGGSGVAGGGAGGGVQTVEVSYLEYNRVGFAQETMPTIPSWPSSPSSPSPPSAAAAAAAQLPRQSPSPPPLISAGPGADEPFAPIHHVGGDAPEMRQSVAMPELELGADGGISNGLLAGGNSVMDENMTLAYNYAYDETHGFVEE